MSWRHASLWMLFLCFLNASSLCAQDQVVRVVPASAIQTIKIWDGAPHNAFTDLVRFKNKLYCVFRESAAHVPKVKEENGQIRVLVSTNGTHWRSFALLSKEGIDLRDPNFSVTADGRLMVLMGGSVYDKGQLLRMQNHVAFLNKPAQGFSTPEPIVMDSAIRSDNNWLWHLTWNKDTGYGVVYQKKEKGQGRNLYLVKTTDGLNYTLVTSLDQDELSNETAVLFKPDETMLLAVRRDAGKDKAIKATGMLGVSKPPYTNWVWSDVGLRLGGPELLLLPHGQLIMGTRAFKDNKPYTGIFVQEECGAFRQLFSLPSGGDNSYPGMLVFKNKLWVSYYSSHEGRTSVYLAAVPIKEVQNVLQSNQFIKDF